MNLDFSVKKDDAWQWSPAVGTDIAEMLELSVEHFEDECAGLLKLDPHRSSKVITEGVINQLYYHDQELMAVARDKKTNQVVAWFWAKRHCMMEFSSEETTELRIIHIDSELTARAKIGLVGQAVSLWHQWSAGNQIPVMVAATLRSEQSAFLRILEACGFTVRGSYAFMRTDQPAKQEAAPVEEPKLYVGAQKK